jgi:methionyl-tRNA synthetase
MLLGLRGPLGDRADGRARPLHLPDRGRVQRVPHHGGQEVLVVARVVIYVRDVLERYDADAAALLAAAGRPESSDTDFTWAEFVRRNNDELVATWGNLVQRVCAMLRRQGGLVPERANIPPDGAALLDRVTDGFASVGDLIERYRFKAALHEVMALAAEVNAFVSQHEPWKVVKTDPEAALGILSVAYDAVCDLNVMFTPFLPHGTQRVWDNLGVPVAVPLPAESEAGEGDDRHRVIRNEGALAAVGIGPASRGRRSARRHRCSPRSTSR